MFILRNYQVRIFDYLAYPYFRNVSITILIVNQWKINFTQSSSNILQNRDYLKNTHLTLSNVKLKNLINFLQNTNIYISKKLRIKQLNE